MTIAKVHARASGAVIVFLVGPIIMRTAKTSAGIVAIEEEQDSRSPWAHSNCFCVFL